MHELGEVSDAGTPGTPTRERYDYTAMGQLADVYVTDPGRAERLAAHFDYDRLGRQVYQVDWRADGQVAYDRQAFYNAKGQIATEITNTRRKPTASGTEAVFRSVTTNGFTDMYGRYTLGAVGTSFTKNYRNGDDNHDLARDTETFNWYAWYDGAALEQVQYQPTATDNSRNNYSYYAHDGGGQLLSVRIDDGRDRTVTYLNDLNGQVVRRDEKDALSGGDPHEFWYRYGGREMGYAGNNGRTDVHYAASTQQRTAPSAGTGAFRGGATTYTSEYDFDTSLAKLNSLHQGSQYGTYTVQGGETLQSIAANLWGVTVTGARTPSLCQALSGAAHYPKGRAIPKRKREEGFLHPSP